jgi:hypothetical protein
MKFVTLLILGCLLAGCADYQSVDTQLTETCEEQAQTKCELVMCKYYQWLDDTCQGWDSCCFCRCWNDGRKIPEVPEECICVEPEVPPDEYDECEGELFESSEECLRDEDQCREWIVETIIEICTYWFR